ncbi:MAG: hypothetical protein AAB480_03295 [Patescibacteria group bacterium]
MQDAGGSGTVSRFVKIWRRVRWPLGIIVIVYIALVILRIPAVLEQRRTAETVDRIHAQRLTLENVDGKHLPPPPDPAQVDATIEGVDANANGIRDDVELAIFEKYPSSPYTRAAELQYAMALQMYLTEVFNSETWVAVAIRSGKGYGCLYDTVPRVKLSDSDEVIQQTFEIVQKRIDETENLVFNTSKRKHVYDEVNRKFTTSFGGSADKSCDLSL